MKSPSRSKSLRTILSGAAMAMLMAVCADASAALIAFNDEAAFNLAIAGLTASTTNFDAVATGTMYPSGTGPTGFTLQLTGPSAASLTPTVSDQFWTTSGAHYLGLNNPDSALQAGDSLSFTFTAAVRGFGLHVIGTADIGAGDLTLTSGGSTAANGALAGHTDGAGSYAYFLGFVSSDTSTFSSVVLHDLTPADARLLNVAIDDVTLAHGVTGPTSPVPEPATPMLYLTGLLAIGALVHRRRGKAGTTQQGPA